MVDDFDGNNLMSDQITTESRDQSSVRLYSISAIGTLALAVLVFFIARPVERTSVPLPDGSTASTAADPHAGHDHPPGEHPDLSAELDRLRLAVREGTAEPPEYLLLGNLLYDQANRTRNNELFAEAAIAYEAYLEQDPANPDAGTDYAYTLYRTGRLDDAISRLRAIREQHPEHQNSAWNLTIMYKDRDQPDSVLHYLRTTVEIDSTTQVGAQAAEVLRAYSEAH